MFVGGGSGVGSVVWVSGRSASCLGVVVSVGPRLVLVAVFGVGFLWLRPSSLRLASRGWTEVWFVGLGRREVSLRFFSRGRRVGGRWVRG